MFALHLSDAGRTQPHLQPWPRYQPVHAADNVEALVRAVIASRRQRATIPEPGALRTALPRKPGPKAPLPQKKNSTSAATYAQSCGIGLQSHGLNLLTPIIKTHMPVSG
jgi:hypothetical protein